MLAFEAPTSVTNSLDYIVFGIPLRSIASPRGTGKGQMCNGWYIISPFILDTLI